MKFGKLLDISNIDFTLPSAHPATQRVLSNYEKASTPEIRVGCSVWAVRGYKGRVLHPKTRTKDLLQAYGQQFSTVELNSTHYHIPRPEMIWNWRDAVPTSFKFSPKMPQYISHRKDLTANLHLLDAFISSVVEFKERLGVSFMQMPPYFKPDRLDQLAAFFNHVPEDLELALEVRNEEWFADPIAQDELFCLLEENGIHAVIADVVGRRDVIHQRLSTGTLLLRFNGHNLHTTDFSRLDAWVDQVKTWLDQGLQRAYIFMHQSEQELNCDTALYFIKRLNEVTGLKVAVPTWYGGSVQQDIFVEE